MTRWPYAPPGKRIRAVFLDYGGTLDANGVPWNDRFFTLYRTRGLDVSRPRFDEAFHAADDSLVAEGVWDASLTEVVQEQVARVLAHLGVRDRALHGDVTAAFVTRSRRQIKHNEDALASLRTRYRTGVISNNYGNLRGICEEMGLTRYFDVLVDSNEVGCTKPDPGIFRAGLERIGIEADEAVMVGDSLPRDMRGALGVGMAHVWLAPAARRSRGPCCPGDPVIGDLDELAELLAR